MAMHHQRVSQRLALSRRSNEETIFVSIDTAVEGLLLDLDKLGFYRINVGGGNLKYGELDRSIEL
jgi:hypothetical protein